MDEAKPPHKKGKAPSMTHGTKVLFNVTCAKCGEADVLPFVPKTQGELLCQKCAAKTFGEGWANGRQLDEDSRQQVLGRNVIDAYRLD